MKMEVLSVQNQFQGQFGVIGSTKVKDWTSPLTTPPPPPTAANRNHSHTTQGGDVVDGADGRQPNQIHQIHHKNHYYHNHHTQHHHQQQQQQQQQQQLNRAAAAMEAATATEPNAASYAYNNNMLCCEPPLPLATAADAAARAAAHFGAANNDIDAAAVNEMSQRLQAELRAAKSRHLACTEVSLPFDLTPRIAAEIIKTSEREPCGVRGCTIFIEFEDEPNNARRIASLKVDPNTVSTFELYLTLKHDKSGWTSLLPQFLKNLTRSSTILISPDFTLTKNKLYSCE